MAAPPPDPTVEAHAGILVPDAALPSGYKLPIHWDAGVATAIWRDVREQSVQRWKDVGQFVKSLRDFAVAQAPIASGAGILAGSLLPVAGAPAAGAGAAAAGVPDPDILLLQQQLAKQHADHAAALIAI
ncbi:hypothetical protein CYMTET_13533 [Cymbomonas tetramitiformis]|uniref:Uncharacterized protein n=1 Tax=Cymbomonas tetramitiformis TaxID=36881 RepID=A0AAE0LB37_9CHLO|nr:hypothetical protein CYMTET_13533 [Cymbomonas tetramitiformis]